MRYSNTLNMGKTVIGEKATCLLFSGAWVPKPFPCNPIWLRMGQSFNKDWFTIGCPPVEAGVVKIESPEKEIRVLRCPIKTPGSQELFVPSELDCFVPLVLQVGELAAAHYKGFLGSHVHLTIEKTWLEPGQYQRVPGWHVDGLQGVRIAPHGTEHSWIWGDALPAQYCPQPFFLNHLDSVRHNMFDEMYKQAREENVLERFSNRVYLIDPYVVHRAQLAKVGCWRTFARITFSDIELEDPANTINLSLASAQDYPDRIEVRDRLYSYDGEIPWTWYGLRPQTRK